MRSRILALAVVLCAFQAPAQVTFPGADAFPRSVTFPRSFPLEYDWYVDSVNGNDLNDGRTPGTAYATLTKLQTNTFSAGARIGLARGSTWKEQITLTASNVLISSYGSGARPLLDAGDEIAAGSWAATAGQTKVYEVSVPIAYTAGNTFINVYENDAFRVKATSVANCEATAGSYYHATISGTPITLYVHPSGDTDPRVDGKTYSYSRRGMGIEAFDAVSPTIVGIRARRNAHTGGSVRIGKNGIGRDLVLEDGSIHNAYLREGSSLLFSEVSGAYAATGQVVMVIYNENTPAGGSVTLDGVYIHLPALNTNSVGVYGHMNTSGAFGAISYRNVIVDGLGTALSSGDCSSVSVSNATITNGTVAFGPGCPVWTISNATSTTTNSVVQFGAAGQTVTADHITAYVTGSFKSLFTSSYANSTITLTDSTLYEKNARFNNAFLFNQAGTVLTGLRNTYRLQFNQFYQVGAGATITSDYNDFADGGGTGVRFTVNGTTYTMAQWLALGSYDSHSTT